MQAKVFDSEAALNRLGGDEELLDDVIGFFLEDAPMYMDQVREGFRAGDAETVHRSAHSLKGLAAQVGGVRAMEVARAVEWLARTGDPSVSSDSGPDLAAAAQRMTEMVQEFERLQAAVVEYRRQHPVVRHQD